MKFTNTLVLFGLVSGAAAQKMSLRRIDTPADETPVAADFLAGSIEHLDLEVDVNGQRQLFPLLPGTACPTGHICRVRNGATAWSTATTSMMGSVKDNMKDDVATEMDWDSFNKNLEMVVASDDYCSRRGAMTRAAGLAAGLAASTVASPAYASETKEVKMGTDSGLLAFDPKKITICSGDSVKWTNNKAGPHNVVFDEDAIPAGVDQESISMSEQLGEEGDTFSMKFDKAGTYEYYCEPHRGAGMQATLVVA